MHQQVYFNQFNSAPIPNYAPEMKSSNIIVGGVQAGYFNLLAQLNSTKKQEYFHN